MQRAHKRDAINTEKFFFRKFVAPFEPELIDELSKSSIGSSVASNSNSCCGDNVTLQDSYEEMTLEEIFCGKCTYYPGLIPLIYAYLEYIRLPPETFDKIDRYLQYIVS